MILISIDPSSTCFGYAVFSTVTNDLRQSWKLLQAALLLPDKGGLSATVRIDQLRRYKDGPDQPTRAIVEIMGTKQFAKAASGRRSSLPVVALAMGRAWGVCVQELGYYVDTVDIAWTQGTTKEIRKAHAHAEYSNYYDPEQDPGGDAADAICMAEYWLERRE